MSSTTTPDDHIGRVEDHRDVLGSPRVRLLAGLLALAVLAFLLRLGGLALGGGLDGRLALDDGTYFAGAVTFANGRLPYRDFNILHPPGILYVLAPFATVASATTEPQGFVLARLGFMLLGAINTFLVGLVGARVGRGTALWAAAIYAVWVIPAMDERSTFLGPPQVAAMLVALLALTGRLPGELTTRRVAAAGVAIGVTGAMQVWAVIPAAVILAWLVLRMRSSARAALRVAATYVASGTATVLVLLAPLLVLAGPRMVEMILFAQASRLGRYAKSPLVRLRELAGLGPDELGFLIPAAVVVALVIAAGMLVLWVAVHRPAVRLWVAIAAAELAFIMAMPLFIWHYGAWPAPVVALSIGAGIAYAIERAPASHRTLAAVAWAAAVVVLAVIGARPVGRQPPLEAGTINLAGVRCVIADEGYYAIRSESLVRSLRNGCRVLPNPRSISHVMNAEHAAGESLGRGGHDDYQAASIDYYTSADVVILSQLRRDGLSDETLATIRAAFGREETVGRVRILRADAP